MTLLALGIFSAAGAGGALSIGAGYVGGGFNLSTLLSTVDKFEFPSDTRTTLGTGLSFLTRFQGAMANSKVAGYFGGGVLAGVGSVTTIDKFAFPADTRTTLGTGLSQNRQQLTAFADSGTAGYFAGGITSDSDSLLSSVEKFSFPSDSRTTLGTGMSSARRSIAGMANSSVAGYVLSGTPDLANSRSTTVDKFAFPSDTRSTLTVTTGRLAPGAMANSGVAGYMGGGFTTASISSVEKFAFPSDTNTTLGTGLSGIRSNVSGMADSGIAGYFAGGGDDVNVLTTVDKFAFPSDTRSTLATGLSGARYETAAMANSAGL